MESIVRERLNRLASALRRFGLVDRFGIGALLHEPELPTVEAIQTRLSREPGELPPAVTPNYLAKFVRRELVSDEHGDEQHSRLLEAVRQLPAIRPGPSGASRYHDQAVKILNLLFGGQLAFEKKEAPEFSGRKRIDILYRNVASDGVFHALWSVHKLHCPYIPVECKNFSEDPENPELDQLAMRLNPDIGAVGILVCRSIKDARTTEQRCADVKRDGKFLFVLSDADIDCAARQRATGSAETVLHEKVRALLLG